MAASLCKGGRHLHRLPRKNGMVTLFVTMVAFFHNRCTCHNVHVEWRFSMPETSRYSLGDKAICIGFTYCIRAEISRVGGGISNQ